MPGMGGFDPNDPNSQPGPPPSGWQRVMRSLHSIVTFFGKIAFLVDENSQAGGASGGAGDNRPPFSAQLELFLSLLKSHQKPTPETTPQGT